jgi:hypothetical protein
VIFVDILDFWVLPKIVKHADKKEKVYYLISSGKISEVIVWKVLDILGHRVEKLKSIFEKNTSPNCRVEFHQKTNQLFHGTVYAKASEQIDSISNIPSCQRERMLAALMSIHCGTLRRELEFVESVKACNFPPGDRKLILLHSSFTTDCFKNYADKKSINIVTYFTPFRVKQNRRNGFYGDTLYKKPFIVRDIIKLIYFFAKCIKTLFLFCYENLLNSSMNKTKGRQKEKYDVLAVLHLHYPRHNEFNELYWLKPLMEKRRIKVLGLITYGSNTEAHDYYNKMTDVLLSERNILSLIDIKVYIQLSLKWCYRIILGLVCGRLEFGHAVYLIQLMERTSFFEAFLLSTGIRFVWNMGELNDRLSTSLALAAGKVGGISLGSTWSMHYYPTPLLRYNKNDILFLSGLRQVEILRDSDAIVKRYVLAGHQTVRHSFQTKADNKEEKPDWIFSSLEKAKKSKVITFYDNAAFFKDDIPTSEEMNQFYSHLLEWVKNNPEYLLILKAKREDYLGYLGEAALSHLEDLEVAGGLVIRQKHADLTSGLAADIVVGCSATGLLLLSSAFGRPTVLLDRHNIFTHWPANIQNLTIIYNPDEIGNAIERSLKLTTFVSKGNGGNIDAFSDLDGDIRTASYINSLMEALPGGDNVDSAIEYADREYTRNWGLDKVRLRNGEPVTVS